MSRVLTINTSRITVLAFAQAIAFVGVAVLTLAASMLMPRAAFAAGSAPAPVAAPAVCTSADQISIELADGSTRCVENTCEAVMGAEGHADQCHADKAPLNVSVPDAGSGVSGVAPPAAPAAVPAATSNERPAATSSASSTSASVILAWILAGIGTVALLAGAVIFARQRRRARAAATAGDEARRARI